MRFATPSGGLPMLADAIRSAISAATTDAPPDGRAVDPPQWLRDSTDPALLRGLAEVWQWRNFIVLRYAERRPVALLRDRGMYVIAAGSPVIPTVEAEGMRVWG